MHKTAIVTGGSSGIGLAAAKALHGAGCVVYEFSRRKEGAPFVRHMQVDVTDVTAVEAAVKEVVAKEGRIDILVSNAGFGISGAAEFTDGADSKKLMDVNLFGMAHVCNAVIPLMREAGGGKIVCTSSVAAAAPIPFQTWYSVSKAAVNAYVCALANELRPFHIQVCAVMPGDIRTGFTAAREKSAAGDDIYGGRIVRSVAKMEQDEQNGMSADKAGSYIARIALKRKVKPLYAIGFSYKLICFLLQVLPCRLKIYLIGKLYAG